MKSLAAMSASRKSVRVVAGSVMCAAGRIQAPQAGYIGSMRVDFEGPEGLLEGILFDPSAAPRAAAVFCHPHPLHGGTMANNVVYRSARALQEAGLAVLRFNFRGVGRSAGVHHGEGGEDQDLAAALAFLSRERPGLPLWAGGFSFGARTASRLASAGSPIERLLLVALPVRSFEVPWIEDLALPTHIIMAGQDEFGTLTDLQSRYPNLPPSVTIEEIKGVDHFFSGQLTLLQDRVRAFAERGLS